MRFSLSSSHALLEMKCDMQISYEMVTNAHVHQLTVSLKYAPQYQLNSFLAMATYWVPDLPNIRGISGQLRHSVFLNLQIVPDTHYPASM